MLDVLIWECEGFFTATQAINEALQQRLRPTFVFMRIQWALDFAANIAKILWGRPRFVEEPVAFARARRLRKRLGITKNRILNNTLLRNSLEHVDARLDEWGQTTKTFNLAMFNMGPKNMIVGLPDDDRFMEYDPAVHEVRMLNQRINLQEIANNVSSVCVLAQKAAAEIDAARFPRPPIP